MSKNLHDIDKIFFEALEQPDDMPAARVWDNIDHHLDKKNIVITRRKYNNLKRLSAALIILLAGSIAFGIYSNSANKTATGKKKSDLLNNEATSVFNNSKTTIAPALSRKPAGSPAPLSAPGNNALMDQPLQHPDNLQQEMSSNAQETGTADHHQLKVRSAGIANFPLAGKEMAAGKKNSMRRKNNTDQPQGIEIAATNHTVSNSTAKNISIYFHPQANFNTQKQARQGKPSDAYSNAEAITAPVHSLHYHAVAGIDPGWHSFPNTLLALPAPINKKHFGIKANAQTMVHINKPKALRISLMASYARQYNFDRIVPDRDHDRLGLTGRIDHDEIKKDEHQQAAVSWGLTAGLSLTKKWGLQTGIRYSSRMIEIKPKKIFAELDTDGQVKYRLDMSNGYTYLNPKTGSIPAVGDSITVSVSSNRLQYLSIPLSVSYTIAFKKWALHPYLGGMVNFSIAQRMETSVSSNTFSEQQNVRNIQGNKHVYFNGIAGMGIEYYINRHLSLILMPEANLALSSISKNAAVKSFPNSFAAGAGIKFQF